MLAIGLAAITIVPTKATPLRCETLTKSFGCQTCTYSKCSDGKRTWTDRLMRCDDEACNKPKFENELPGDEDFNSL